MPGAERNVCTATTRLDLITLLVNGFATNFSDMTATGALLIRVPLAQG